MPVTLGQTVSQGVDGIIDVSDVTAWDFLWALLVIAIGIVLARSLRRGIRTRLAASSLDDGLVSLLARVAGWLTFMLAVFFALPFLGFEFTPLFLIVLLAAAVAVVSGKTLIENYGAGVVLQAEGKFTQGDEILAMGYLGRVREISSRVVDIEALDGRKLILPNASVMAGPVEVFTHRPVRRSELIVGLEYGTELETARQVLSEATQRASSVLSEPPVEVFAGGFGESSIDLIVWYWHRSDLRSGYEATDDVVRSIKRACDESGLKIAFPQRTLWWGNHESTTE